MKKNIALVAGGFAGEFEVSINSAKNIAKSLKDEDFTVYTIIIERDSWYHEAMDGRRTEIDKNDFSLNLTGTKLKFAAVLITVHGTPGEDGRLQGYFDLVGMPYTTCDTTTSALAMNKGFTKSLVKEIPGLHVARSVNLVKLGEHLPVFDGSGLSLPLFVKPNNGGSSVGMSKVNTTNEIGPALAKAFHEDEQVLVEEFISGREFSIGLFSFSGTVTVLPPTEIISTKEFFDYEAKYTPGMSREITPAALETAQVAAIAAIVKEVYLLLNCRGMARVDFILQETTGDFYFIEINTTPGQSAASIYPQQLRAANIPEGWFYAELIREALRVKKEQG